MIISIANFRDAASVGSGSLRPGVVYRSAELSSVSDTDLEHIADLGVAHVFDLRTADEVAHRPDRLPESIHLRVLDVLADRPHSGAAAVASLVTDKQDHTTIDDVNDAVGFGRARDLMIETYRHLVSLPSAHANYRELFSGIAQAQGASIVHCTAGKDRTGWAIAVIQHLMGVRHEDVLADYLATNERMSIAYGPMLDRFEAAGGDVDSLRRMIFVEPDYLDAAATLVRKAYGDFEHYLSRALGMRGADITALKERLTA